MSQVPLLIRCLIEKKGDQWQAFSLEFGLAVQADSEAEAKQKLDDMIRSYLYDALVGEDRGHAAELLKRKATWAVRARYAFHVVVRLLRNDSSVYADPIHMAPMSA